MRARLLVTMLCVLLGVTASAVPSLAGAEGEESIDYHEWSSAEAFGAGDFAGTRLADDGLRIGQPIGTFERAEPDLGTRRTYEYARWTSPEYQQGFDATELVASWNARAPEGTWLQIEVAARTNTGARTAWYDMGQWAESDATVRRTSVREQSDEHAQVNVDTLAVKGETRLRAYQLRLTLYRELGLSSSPAVSSAGAMTSNVPDRFDVPVSPPGEAIGIELDVPPYAQNIHKGRYPEYGGGGEVWCSPTATEMVVEYFGHGPGAEELSWIPPDYPDPSVAHAARFTYDYAYAGTGNWPFNTAYAARYGLDSHVTRLNSLAEAEEYILRGIPVITSQSFLAHELPGAGYGTAGHIMVIIGFTAEGDVIVNDPAADANDEVRTVYPREQFEEVWQRTKRRDENGNVASGPGGIAYIIRPQRPSA